LRAGCDIGTSAIAKGSHTVARHRQSVRTPQAVSTPDEGPFPVTLLGAGALPTYGTRVARTRAGWAE